MSQKFLSLKVCRASTREIIATLNEQVCSCMNKKMNTIKKEKKRIGLLLSIDSNNIFFINVQFPEMNLKIY